jgi:hypothetical protein
MSMKRVQCLATALMAKATNVWGMRFVACLYDFPQLLLIKQRPTEVSKDIISISINCKKTIKICTFRQAPVQVAPQVQSSSISISKALLGDHLPVLKKAYFSDLAIKLDSLICVRQCPVSVLITSRFRFILI